MLSSTAKIALLMIEDGWLARYNRTIFLAYIEGNMDMGRTFAQLMDRDLVHYFS